MEIVCWSNVWGIGRRNSPPWPNIPDLTRKEFNEKDDYDAYVTYCVDRPSYIGLRRRAFDTIRKFNKPTISLECPAFLRNLEKPWRNFRMGWNHYLASGEFNNRDVPNDRLERILKSQNLTIAHEITHKPDGAILIVLPPSKGGSINDMYELYGNRPSWWDDLEHEDALKDAGLAIQPPIYHRYHSRWCIINWLRNIISEIREISSRPIVIRPHPGGNSNNKDLQPGILKILKEYKHTCRSNSCLETDLSNAALVVGWGSTVLIESIMLGIPTVTLSKAAQTYEVSEKTIRSGLTEGVVRDYDKIYKWLCGLAYTQWSVEEITNGTAWDHLKGGYNHISKSYLDVNMHFRSSKF